MWDALAQDRPITGEPAPRATAAPTDDATSDGTSSDGEVATPTPSPSPWDVVTGEDTDTGGVCR